LEVGSFLAVARRWWVTLLAATCVAAFAGFSVEARAPQFYEARVRLLVGPVNTDMGTLRASGQLARTYAELATSRPVLSATIEQLELPETPEKLAASVFPTADSGPRILIVRVHDLDPVRAARIADEIGRQLSAYAAQGADQVTGQLTVVDPAIPGVPTGAPPSLLVIAAGLAGLVGAFTLVLLREYLNETVRDERDLAAVTGVAAAGTMSAPGWRSGRLTTRALRSPRSEAADEFRILPTKIRLVAEAGNARSILLVGTRHVSQAGELAANVATVWAEQGRVVVIDASRAGDMASLFDLQGSRHLLAVEPGPPCDLDGGIVAVDDRERLWLVRYSHAKAGASAPACLLSQLLERTDAVVVYADGPVDASPATLLWARHVDAVVLVAQAEKTRTKELRGAVESLSLAGARLAATILATGQSRRGARRRRPPWLQGVDASSRTTPFSDGSPNETQKAPRVPAATERP
jgi:capsular polysaccharide biosynthesis protein